MIVLKSKWISRRSLLLLPVVCAMCFAWLGCRLFSAAKAQNAAPAKSEMKPMLQKPRLFHTASKEDINDTILITGELRAERSRDLTVPRIQSGFASSVTFLALEGTKVKQGER